MEIGKIASITVTCDKTNVAGNLGSGDVDVFATPSMIANMEYAAAKCVLEDLEEGQTTVGTYLDVKHTAATPMGMKVTCYAELTGVRDVYFCPRKHELTGVEGKMLTFKVWAEDECGPIGEGTHGRAIINREKFLARVNAKKAQ